jgi:glutamine amidotransferase
MIVIVDYGMGNVGSIFNMLKKVGCKASISRDPSEIMEADKLILPGVGAFDEAISNLQQSRLVPVLNRRVLEDRCPVLGICLGMQLMSKRSEEGKLPGLGWIEAETRRFCLGSEQGHLKIPHMGWNLVDVLDSTGIFAGFEEPPRFYFVHSYHVCCDDRADVLATSTHGDTFTSAVRKNNIFGTQFHPEKSHKYGMRLLLNFASLP